MKIHSGSLNEVIAELKKVPYVEAVILFGSHARGTAREDSDIDLAVVTQGATKEQEWNLIEKTPEFDICAFSRLPLVIQFRVIKEGKILFVRNKKELHNLYMRKIQAYLDFEPFIEEFYRRVIYNV